MASEMSDSNGVIKLRSGLGQLSAVCGDGADIPMLCKLIKVALGADPEPSFLSDLFDVSVEAVKSLSGTAVGSALAVRACVTACSVGKHSCSVLQECTGCSFWPSGW